MNFEIFSTLTGDLYEKWRSLILSAGLNPEPTAERCVLAFEGDELVGAGSRDGWVLKHIAVSASHRGEDITSGIITELRRDAFAQGHSHLFLYTKPENRYTFESLFFYPVVETDGVLVMENKKDGISAFLRELPSGQGKGTVGAVVMNCNPFTLGHRALIEKAASECDTLFVFVLSEDRSEFPFSQRFEMVKLGTKDIKNVTVLKTGPYLISSATFPTYFLKDRDSATRASCLVDVKIFSEFFAPRLSINRRYVGTEPTSRLTEKYNEALKEWLPSAGIEVREIERVTSEGKPISAGEVRRLLLSHDTEGVRRLVPKTTFDYLKSHGYV